MESSSVEVILRDRATEVDAIYALASTLQCNLDRRTVAVLIELLERGVHPESLADIINEIRQTAR
jgi:mitotic-spindle organizing protein 1